MKEVLAKVEENPSFMIIAIVRGVIYLTSGCYGFNVLRVGKKWGVIFPILFWIVSIVFWVNLMG